MKQLYTIIISLLILSSCSTSNDVVSNKKVQKRKYTKGFVVKKSDKKFFNNLSFKNVELHAKSDKIAEDKTDIFLATSSAYPSGVFNPVPTAVPPNAKERNISADFSILKIPFLICSENAENS